MIRPTEMIVREVHCTRCDKWVVTSLNTIRFVWHVAAAGWNPAGYYEGVCPDCAGEA